MTNRDRYQKHIATIRLVCIEGPIANQTARCVVEHCDEGDMTIPMAVGDRIVVTYAPEIESPDGKSLVRAAWAVLLDILGFKKVEPR